MALPLTKWINLGKPLNFSDFWIHSCKTWGLELRGTNVLSESRKSIRKTIDLWNFYKCYYLKYKLKNFKVILPFSTVTKCYSYSCFHVSIIYLSNLFSQIE